MIQFEQVFKRYPNGGADVLSDVSFHIRPGELVRLTGHSGAGKSTLLKLIAAIERPTGGTIMISSQNTSALKAAALPYLRRTFGLIFQDQKLLGDRNVFENVMLPLRIIGHDPKDAPRRVRAALDKVGLLDREKAMPVQLSGGEQQRLAIARAVVGRPSILLADEPTAHLDKGYADEIAAMFLSFQQVGVTVVIATHDTAMLERHITRHLHIADGRVSE